MFSTAASREKEGISVTASYLNTVDVATQRKSSVRVLASPEPMR
jgi:hypothetical protein